MHELPPSKAVTVVQLTDPHLFAAASARLLNVPTTISLEGVIEHIVARQARIDLLLATGDITQDGSAQAHRRFLEMAARVPAPLRGLPGNHDTGATFGEIWGESAEPVTDIGNWRIISLDSRIAGSNAGRLGENQFDLLRKAAEAAEDRHVMIALHHNPVPCGSEWLDTMMLADAAAFFEVLRRFPRVRAVLWGHVHQEFDRIVHISPNHGLRLLATPSTSVQFAPSSKEFKLDTAPPGYRRLLLHANGELETEVVRVPGLGLEPESSSKGY